MDTGSSETNSLRHPSLTSIDGFRVQCDGQRLSPGFKRALRRLRERGFDDPACAVVKTKSGNQSGITHAGGRYVHPDNPHCAELMGKMRDLGMEPPPPPFVIGPGEYTLYHEWGHHVDRTWSGDNEEVLFSFRWLSHFYELVVRHSPVARVDQAFSADDAGLRAIESDLDAADAVVFWWHAASELFADLFEDWMREERRVAWDQCEPQSLNAPDASAHPLVKVRLLPGVRAEDVRAETYLRFMAGIRSAPELPSVRPGAFGGNTDKTVGLLQTVLRRARARLL